MVSEFRNKKLTHVFNFFDTDKSGNIEKKDFELAVEKISKARGWAPGDAKFKEAQDTLLKVWDGIQKEADSDNDGAVSASEWIQMWDKFAKSPAPLEWQTLYGKFIFSVQDASSDGAIDSNEFSSVHESFGINKDEAAQAFQKMSKGKSSVTWPEFQELWKQYFASEDPNAPGNFIFGKTSI